MTVYSKEHLSFDEIFWILVLIFTELKLQLFSLVYKLAPIKQNHLVNDSRYFLVTSTGFCNYEIQEYQHHNECNNEPAEKESVVHDNWFVGILVLELQYSKITDRYFQSFNEIAHNPSHVLVILIFLKL